MRRIGGEGPEDRKRFPASLRGVWCALHGVLESGRFVVDIAMDE